MSTADERAATESGTPAPRRRDRLFWFLVALVAVVGLTARLWNSNFDQRQHLHPDERFWSLTSDALHRAPEPAAHGTVVGPLLDWLDGQRSPANPYRVTESFVYGPTPLALARGTSAWLYDGVVHGDQPANAIAHAIDAIGVPLINDAGAPTFDSAYSVDVVGRLMSAIFDTATIVVVALIGRRIGGRLAGVAAASLYAMSVLAIQHAHFLGAEPLLGLASALTVLASLRLDRSNDVRRAVTTGLALGAACGLTVAVKLTGASLLAVVLVGCVALLWRHRRRSDVTRLAAVLVGAAIAFRFFDPAAFNGLGVTLSRAFTDDLQRAQELKTSTSPPSFQWANRIPIVQPLVWLGAFTVGPGTVFAASVGAVAMSARLVAHRLGRRVEGWATRASSLMTDIGLWPCAVVIACVVVPFLYISVASVPTGRYYIPMLPALYAMAGLGVAVLIRLVVRSAGRTRAVATGIAVASVGLATIWGVGFVHGVYGHTNTRIAASEWIASNVPTGSVLSSEAWDDALPLRLPGLDANRFPIEQLNLVGPDDETKVATVAEQLGRIDYVVESSPRIWATVTRMPDRFPSTINFFKGLDSGALGFERVATFRGGISLGPWRLDDQHADESFSVVDHPQVRIWRKVQQLDRETIVSVLDPVAAANAVAIDPNRASANGLLLTSGEIARNESGSTYDEEFDTDGSTVLQLLAWFVLLEVLGVAAFALFLPLMVRLPDAGWGVAKLLALGSLAFALFVGAAWLHMDLGRPLVAVVTVGFLTAGGICTVRRQSALRAVWRERRPLLIAAEALSVTLFIAFLLVRAWNPDLWHPDRGGEKPFELALLTAVLRTKTLPVYDPWYSHGALNYYYGGWFLLAAPARLLRTPPALVMNLAMAVFASVSAGAVFSLGAGAASVGRTRWRRRSRRLRTAFTAGLLSVGFVLLLANTAILRAMWERPTGGLPSGRIDWWGLSRVIPHSVAVTEFPAWSLLFGDVHPHVMGIGVIAAVGVLCLAWYAALVDGRRAAALALAVMLGGGIGLTRMTNTWDFPLALGITGATLLLALAVRVPWRRLVVPALVVVVMVVFVWSPYVRRGEVFDGGFDASILRTPPSSWLRQFGFFAAVTVVLVGARLAQVLPTSVPVWRWVTRAHVAVVAASVVALAYLWKRPGFETFEIAVALAIGSVWVAWEGWRGTPRQPPIAPLLLAVGWAIQAGVEMLSVRNDAGRQNTVFKFWYESWIVLAIGCAVVIAQHMRSRITWLRRTSWILAGCALVMAVGFWTLALPVRVDDRISDGGPSLDGEAYLTDQFVYGAGPDRFVPADDMPLVDWLRANVRGIHVQAEAPGNDYKWTGRISWLTGLPTPIGWGYHETQQRRPYGDSLTARRDAMTQLYTTTDVHVVANILSRYDVEYLVFGTQERLLASPESAAALRSFECLTVVASADRTTESGVEPDELFVATVDQACVNRLRPPLPSPPPTA